ncbi:TRAP-type C4-dicarboxylate transport system permease small subunit [Primorskyibacter sedentarius]|uniref:TRAP transporter small permease protein n=1 Tax=Primorskyibacter sedentarius TaxID=745311 RepID=A0A4R3JMG6_9RHOB|nr:TRAP transporter small permease subunit [Primorskyibacter sedentarius]TCS67588.1 TRAP-type C4-dicarboxylate transport system permease small subunit [Primorskyibacter sedentarius]
MAILKGLLAPLQFVNTHVLRLGRAIAVFAMAIMVLSILYQVVMRYGFNAAPNWSEELARFCMLWMTGLVAPAAYRRGGFVAIDTLTMLLPRNIGAVLNFVLLALALLVLVVALQLGLKHVNSGWLFASSSLRLPLDLIGMAPVKLKLAWMFMSLYVGVILLTSVTVELLLRQLVRLTGGGDDLPPLPTLDTPGAE